jgi:hypothetical protein
LSRVCRALSPRSTTSWTTASRGATLRP